MFQKKIILFIVIAVTSFSCKKIFIEPEGTSETEKSFEIFWNDVNNGYPYFAEDGIDWKARYKQYKPLISSSTPTVRLYTYMCDMLKGFSDGHLSVSYAGNTYVNEKTRPNLSQIVKEDGSQSEITVADAQYFNNFTEINKSYLQSSTYSVVSASDGIRPFSDNVVCIYGLCKQDNIIYINITTFLTQYRFEELIRNVISKYPTSKGMILDLRMNEGGNLATMWNAMSVFLPPGVAEVKYAYNKEKVGPLPENFGKETYFAVSSTFGEKYTKPVVVLVNRVTISSAEHAAMAMREIKKHNPKIKLVGDNTFGATSFIVERTLPNGIQYTLVNSKTMDINHQVIERTGIKPDIYKHITPSKLDQNIDDQFQEAIDIIVNDNF